MEAREARRDPRDARVARLERIAAWASLGAGAIHGVLVRDHLEEWWGYGLFFAAAALVQVLFGLALITDAVNPRDTGDRWHSAKAWVYRFGIAANIGLIALYVVTRTTGIPFFGPAAGEVEAVTPLGIASKALELVALAALVALLRGHGAVPVKPGEAPR